MDSCCNNQYNHTFGMKKAQKEMDHYLKYGPKKSTVWLLDPVVEQIKAGDSVLEVGGGVGSFLLELQKQGVGPSYYMDISESYSAVFQHQVNNQSLENKINVHTGDFTEKHHLIPDTDVVALDKVLCCYQDFKQLLSLSLDKAGRIFAYTVPDDVWWVRFIHQIETALKQLFTKHLITYIHPVDQIESQVVAKGFQKVFQKSHTGWLTVVCCK